MIELKNNENPIEYIWNIVKDLKYGYHSVKDNTCHETMMDMAIREWRILSPKEVLEKKYGVCYDQSILVAYLADQLSLKYRSVNITLVNTDSHSTTVIQYNDKWYWIESAWSNLKGVYGPYDTLEEIYQFIRETIYSDKPFYPCYWTVKDDISNMFNDEDICYNKYFIEALNISYRMQTVIKMYFKINDIFDFVVNDKLLVTKILYKNGTSRDWNPINPMSCKD